MKQVLALCPLLSLLCCLPLSGQAATAVLPAPVVGNYQALLYTGTDLEGVPAGLVTLAATANGKATGKVTTAENKTYPFTATFVYAEDAVEGDSLLGTATANPVTIARGATMPALGLALTIAHNTDGLVLNVVLSSDGVADRVSNSGFRTMTFAPKTTADWAGKYTLAFEAAEAPPEGEPQGAGYAAGTVAASGVLALAGKTGDGVGFTAALAAGPNRNYVAYLNPYKTAGSLLAGKFTLVTRDPAPGFHVAAAEAPLVDFYWQKAAKATDKSYRLGFGPIGLLLTMEPWTPLLKNQTLAQALGMEPGEIFDVAFSSHFNTTTYSSRTPISLGLDAKNNFVVAKGGSGSPSPLLPKNWSKLFALKVNLATGVMTGSITVTDTIPAPPSFPPKPGKVVTRKLVIEGVLLRLADIGEVGFAAGFMNLPPIDPKTATAVTAAFTFNGPFKVDPLVASMGQIAGSYQAIFDVLITSATAPSKIPADDATVNFSVSSDLKTMVFNGRTLALDGDGRPLNLIYRSTGAVTDTLLVTLAMSLVTGDIQKCDATYLQVAGFTVKSANVLSRNNPAQTIVKLP